LRARFWHMRASVHQDNALIVCTSVNFRFYTAAQHNGVKISQKLMARFFHYRVHSIKLTAHCADRETKTARGVQKGKETAPLILYRHCVSGPANSKSVVLHLAAPCALPGGQLDRGAKQQTMQTEIRGCNFHLSALSRSIEGLDKITSTVARPLTSSRITPFPGREDLQHKNEPGWLVPCRLRDSATNYSTGGKTRPWMQHPGTSR